jgi:ubiquinone/menaquinone biosynthesis C-methylase UbiE
MSKPASAAPSAEYVHGTTEYEQNRLAGLNAITNNAFIDYLAIKGGESICDVGCGLGKLSAEIARRIGSIRVDGLERSPEYFAAARAATSSLPNCAIVQGDAHALPYSNGQFDVTFCRYLLEHVAAPHDVAKEMIRVTKPGGRIVAQENDLHYVVYWPEIPGHDGLLRGFCRLQQILGGDPFIGRKLYTLFDTAETASVELSISPEIYTARDPERFRAWLGNSMGIFQASRQALLDRGLVSATSFDAVLSTMKDRIEHPVGVAHFHWNRVTAVKRT